MLNDYSTIKRLLQNGQIIAYPTETLWALGGLSKSIAVAKKINYIKKRNQNKNLISVTSDLKYCQHWLDQITSKDKELIEQQSKKYSISWLIPEGKETPNHLVKDGYIALRLSYYPAIITLCNLIKQPIISTSANLSNQEPYNYTEINTVLKKNISYIVQLEKNWHHPSGKASKIVNIKTKEIIRA